MTRILVVEDEESFSDPLSYLLRKEGYEVAVADDGPAALQYAASEGKVEEIALVVEHGRLRRRGGF